MIRLDQMAPSVFTEAAADKLVAQWADDDGWFAVKVRVADGWTVEIHDEQGKLGAL